MVFNSLEFLVFFLALLFAFSIVFDNRRARELLLLVASYAFYTAWYLEYALLIAFSTIVDYSVGQALHRERRQAMRRALVTLSLMTNLGLLGFFKYFNFFATTATGLGTWLGADLAPIRHEFLLPVGISFYTFQTLSYTIDIYRRRIEPEPSLTRFALFVSFFPQLVAGPIVRAAEFLPQLQRKPNISQAGFIAATGLVFVGLFKKVVFADTLAVLAVDPIFRSPESYSAWDLLMGLYGYAFQIYCDFSGYTDIAIGIAAMLGFQLPINFNRPYLAVDPRDFWRRWHISLSSWLRDYLYISLGGGRRGRWMTVRNLFITMLLGGLWHGAAMNFIIWGAYHGLLLSGARLLPSAPRTTFGTWTARIITFHLILVGWLLFRVPDMQTFSSYSAGLLSFSGGSQLQPLFYVLLILVALMHVLPKVPIRDALESLHARAPVWVKGGVYAACIIALMGVSSVSAPKFIYFQF